MTDLIKYFFSAKLQIIGINPFVFIPEDILVQIFLDATNKVGPIPVCGKVNGTPYTQTLLKYKGACRLYINTTMLQNSPRRIGEILQISVSFDASERTIEIPILFREALARDKMAKHAFDNLTPSLQKEINRYLNAAKKEETLIKNIYLAIGFLKGENRFIGRDPIKK